MGHRLTASTRITEPKHGRPAAARSPADQAPDVPLWNLTRGWIPTHLKRMALGVARGALPCTLRPCSNNGWAPASSSERASWPPQEVVPRHACVLVGGRTFQASVPLLVLLARVRRGGTERPREVAQGPPTRRKKRPRCISPHGGAVLGVRAPTPTPCHAQRPSPRSPRLPPSRRPRLVPPRPSSAPAPPLP